MKIFFGYILYTTCFSYDDDDDDDDDDNDYDDDDDGDDNIKNYRSLMLYPYKLLSIGRIVISI